MSEQAAVDETPPTLSSRTALAGALSAHGQCAEALALLAVPEAEADDRAVTVLLAACARRDGDRGEARVREGASPRAAALHVHGGDAGARRGGGIGGGPSGRDGGASGQGHLRGAPRHVHGRVDVAERVSELMRRYGIE